MPDPEPINDDIVTIYQAQTLAEAEMFADQLADADIRSFIANDESPLDGLTSAEQGVIVSVLGRDVDRARAVAESFVAEHDATTDTDADTHDVT